jgi:HAD superfamily hydrolase (TIGR01490 family)
MMQTPPRHRLAIYDMDKTITRKATFGPFISHVLKRYRPGRAVMLPAMAAVTAGYGLNLVDRTRLKEINLGLLLGNPIDRAEAARMAESFAMETRRTNFLSEALRRIAADRAAGYRIILATASYRFYVEAIAQLLAIDEVIATRCLAAGEEAFLPQIAGQNCYGEAKLMMVKDWLRTTGLKREDCHIRFYSDHVSDAPCLAFADEAFATNPHAPLRELAGKRGWPVLDWPE